MNLKSESLKFAWGRSSSCTHSLRRNVNCVLQRKCKGNGLTPVCPTVQSLYLRKNSYAIKPMPCNEQIPILHPGHFLKTKIPTLKEGGSGEEVKMWEGGQGMALRWQTTLSQETWRCRASFALSNFLAKAPQMSQWNGLQIPRDSCSWLHFPGGRSHHLTHNGTPPPSMLTLYGVDNCYQMRLIHRQHWAPGPLRVWLLTTQAFSGHCTGHAIKLSCLSYDWVFDALLNVLWWGQAYYWLA